MAKFTFYFRVDRDYPAQGIKAALIPGIKAGVYAYRSEYTDTHLGWTPILRTLIQNSSKVWRQGPRGGVKIIKNRNISCRGYVTTNQEQMKEFVWVKLQARAV